MSNDLIKLKIQNLQLKRNCIRTSLVAQWLRIHLPMQGTGFRALDPEDPPCHRATKPVRLERMLCNKRSHRNEKPATAMTTQHSHK